MPLEKPAAFDSLVEAICQVIDSPLVTPGSKSETAPAEQDGTEATESDAHEAAKTHSQSAGKQQIRIGRDD
jgi:hypothetical protein